MDAIAQTVTHNPLLAVGLGLAGLLFVVCLVKNVLKMAFCCLLVVGGLGWYAHSTGQQPQQRTEFEEKMIKLGTQQQEKLHEKLKNAKEKVSTVVREKADIAKGELKEAFAHGRDKASETLQKASKQLKTELDTAGHEVIESLKNSLEMKKIDVRNPMKEPVAQESGGTE